MLKNLPIIAAALLVSCSGPNAPEPNEDSAFGAAPVVETGKSTDQAAEIETVDTTEPATGTFTGGLHAEVDELAAGGDKMMELFVVLRDAEPDVYQAFTDEIQSAYDRGERDMNVYFEAGARVRPKFLAAFAEAQLTTTDELTLDILRLGPELWPALAAQSGQECFRNMMGQAPSNPAVIPADFSAKETQLMIDVFKNQVGQQPIATDAEFAEWLEGFRARQPEAAADIGLLQYATLNDQQAMRACKAMMAFSSDLSSQPKKTAVEIQRYLTKAGME